jgi:hypothetical protein
MNSAPELLKFIKNGREHFEKCKQVSKYKIYHIHLDIYIWNNAISQHLSNLLQYFYPVTI